MAEAKAYVMIPHSTATECNYEIREFVLCKNCKFAKKHNCNIIRCLKEREYGTRGTEMEFHEANWFCADGERRTDDA